jgi:tetratricopeptide (TPR) repeat protein
MERMKPMEPTPVSGIRYAVFPTGSEVTGRDRKVRIACGDLPFPLLEDDCRTMEGPTPSYDAIGRGIYHLLRANPDCTFADRYARILQEGYPHIISEMASQLLMMDKKDMDVAYLDRKITCLKIFALMEPDNGRLPMEIGMTFMDKGLRIPLLNQATASLYHAEEHLRKAFRLSPGDPTIRYQLGAVSYILGKYDEVLLHWRGVVSEVEEKDARKIGERLGRIEAGCLPRVPAVDYLEAIGAAFLLHHQGEFAEAAGILLDVLDDAVFCEEFPMPEMFYVLGLCCSGMGMPRYAEDYFTEALRLKPEYREARTALVNLCA